MVKRKLLPPLIFLICFCGRVCCQRTGTGPRDRGNPEYRPDQYDTGRGGGPTNNELGLVPSTGTGAKDRMGGGGNPGQDHSISQGELIQGPNEGNTASSNLAVNLTHALAVDQGIAEGGGEDAYLDILR